MQDPDQRDIWEDPSRTTIFPWIAMERSHRKLKNERGCGVRHLGPNKQKRLLFRLEIRCLPF
jgi:hypothetical protein